MAMNQPDARIRSLPDSQQVVAEQSSFKMFTIWFTAIGVALIVGLGVAKWFMPSPILPLTSNQIVELEKGRLVELAWPKMTKDEKDRIARLATEAEKKRQDSAGQINYDDYGNE